MAVKEEELADTGVDDLLKETEQIVRITPKDGEFSSFPEIHRKTVDVLLNKAGYKSLFPV